MSRGVTDLAKLLATMQPALDATPYVFATVSPDDQRVTALRPLMSFREDEGLTLIVGEAEASGAGLAGAYRCRRITLAVHSSLAAIGFLAAVTERLAQAGISANAVSAFHHDHLFVPADRADETLRLLQELSAEAL